MTPRGTPAALAFYYGVWPTIYHPLFKNKRFQKFCLVPEGTFSRFLAIFLDFRQKWQKSKNIEFRASLSTAIALIVVFRYLADKYESEKKYAGVPKPYPAAYSRNHDIANLA